MNLVEYELGNICEMLAPVGSGAARGCGFCVCLYIDLWLVFVPHF